MCNPRMFKNFGAILSLLAAATFSIGISNLVLTSQSYCSPWMDDGPVYCSSTGEPYVWTWVGSGIWASAPIFVAGLIAMCLGKDPGRWTRLFAILIFFSSIVCSPAILILSSIEVWRGSASKWNFYQLGDNLMQGNIMVEDSPYQAKFALPLVITILAAIMFVMTGIITMALCCCMQTMGMCMPQASSGSMIQQIYQPAPAPLQTKEVYCPPRAPPCNSCDYMPTSGSNMATRYSSVVNNPGVMFGNFPSRAPVNNYSNGNPGYRYQ